MTIQQFSDKIIRMFPIKGASEDELYCLLHMRFAEYLTNIRQLDSSAFSNEAEKLEIYSGIGKIVASIQEVISLYFKGRHGESFRKFQEYLEAPNGPIDALGVVNIAKETELEEKEGNGAVKIKSVPNVLFRSREFADKRNHTYEEMFHIPLDKRGIVKTQRYSAPGYPCLYLGKTIYACWEEMHRPRFDELMVSGFRVRRPFRVYDLRVPKRTDFNKESLIRTLLRLPLIIACSVKVKNENDPYKPEYIIPQLLIESIISRNYQILEEDSSVQDPIYGVIYTSTHISTDFPYGLEYLENIALPVVNSDIRGVHCEILASLFEISDPLCSEYEQMKEFQQYLNSYSDKKKDEYNYSLMGRLETRIKNCPSYHILD